jgi:hypothetical protein
MRPPASTSNALAPFTHRCRCAAGLFAARATAHWNPVPAGRILIGCAEASVCLNQDQLQDQSRARPSIAPIAERFIRLSVHSYSRMTPKNASSAGPSWKGEMQPSFRCTRSFIGLKMPNAAACRDPPDGGKVMEWFSRTASIAGTRIPNWVLVLGAIVVIWLIYRFAG